MKISTNVMHNYSILPVTNFKTEKQNNGADQVLKKKKKNEQNKIIKSPLILGAGHPKFKNLKYLLCDLLDLTKQFISVISEL